MWKWIVGVPTGLFLAMFLFGTYVNATPEGKAATHARAAIDLCWQEHDKKSITEAEKRFIAELVRRWKPTPSGD